MLTLSFLYNSYSALFFISLDGRQAWGNAIIYLMLRLTIKIYLIVYYPIDLLYSQVSNTNKIKI